MVNHHDPVVVAQDYMALSKLWHAMAGLYFWEFVTTLDYEWSVFRRNRPFRWTIWIYFTTRIAALLAIILCLVDINVTARYNCRVVTIFVIGFSFLATTAASLLIVLRILAIWNMKKIIIAIATGAWVADVVFQIQTIVRIRVGSIPGNINCVVANPRIANLNSIVSFATDIILLLIMFFGLFRLRFYKSSAFGMGRLLWRQALVWLLVALMANILPVVFICLNLNDPLDDIFLVPWVVALSIAATRIHRGLVDYASVEQLVEPVNTTKVSGRAERKATRVPISAITHTQLSPIEVAIPEVYEMYEQDETPQKSQRRSAGSLLDVEGQLYEESGGQIRFDENVEDGGGSATEISMT